MGIDAGTPMDEVIRLERDRVTDVDLQIVVGAFEAAWARVPPSYQGLIENYWRGRVAPNECRGKPNTREEYDPHILVYDDTRLASQGAPAVHSDGHVILLPVRLLADMGNEFAEVAVAHELAHVSFYAASEPNHWADHKTAATYDAAEGLVDERMKQWGFSQPTLQKLDAWMTDRGFTRFQGMAGR